jgi:hypothetical protein
MLVRPATLAAWLFAVVALAVAGCGGDEETPSGSAATPAATATETEQAQTDAEEGKSEAEREREAKDGAESGGKDCSEAGDLEADAKKLPPAEVEVPAYIHIYKSEGPFGKTERFYGVLDGGPEELPARRDDAANQIVQKSGYVMLDTDQEEGTEAEAHLKGDKHTVDIQVSVLCAGKLRVRYTVS